jgi:hypothetical protein
VKPRYVGDDGSERLLGVAPRRFALDRQLLDLGHFLGRHRGSVSIGLVVSATFTSCAEVDAEAGDQCAE